MGLILCIETATEVCSVALALDEKLLGIKESSARNVHSAMLTLFIEEIIKSSGKSLGDLDAVAISMGPGSYTGLRIGVATAKGLCYALDKPLIAIPTLQAMAVGIRYEVKIKNLRAEKENPKSKILFCPMIDARRMEVYSELYDESGMSIREVRAEIIDAFSFQEFFSENSIVFGGPGAAKCSSFLSDHPNALFLEGFQPSARFVMGLAEKKFREDKIENLAYSEPFYLKDFIAGKSRVKGLI